MKKNVVYKKEGNYAEKKAETESSLVSKFHQLKETSEANGSSYIA